ncbi:hypothetical protein JCM5296_005723 [Sporobolomyces johnsonii]
MAPASPSPPPPATSSSSRTSSTSTPERRRDAAPSPPDSPPSATRSRPLSRQGRARVTSPRPTPRPVAHAHPSYISIPPPGQMSSRDSPSDAVSPLSQQSASFPDSGSSRVAPDLSSSSARYYPMRSVMYPSNSASFHTGRSTSSVTSTDRPSKGGESVTSGGSRSGDESSVAERLAEDFGASAPRPGMSHRGSSGKTHRGAGEHAPQTLLAESDPKPPSLDPFLSERTTHAKEGDPDSDEEVLGEEDDAAESVSNVQVRDFAGGDKDSGGRRTQGDQPKGVEGVLSDRASTSRTGESSAGSKPIVMTSRFEHQISDDGAILVLTGREGELMNCEDEPIHAPGAIQAFGVLIAFELQNNDRMRVRQVSENSGFILGIPPKALFRAKCLSDLLSEDEADALRDAVDALDDRDLDPSNEESGPYTFTLTGHGLPGTGTRDARSPERLEWTCHAAIHRPSREKRPNLVVLELELVDDQLNPLTTTPSEPITSDERVGFAEPDAYGKNGLINPTEADLLESTVSLAKPLRVLARAKARQAKRANKSGSRIMGEMDVLHLLSQINEQLGKASELASFLKIVAGVFRELTEFDRVMVYQFDEAWNGRVVAEQVDWSRTKDLFRGLNFPASDIPPQARELYRVNKVRLLYDRDQPTARLCCRDIKEVEDPLDMTHCHLRAMSPIHIKYLGNMGVRSSMSISITAFGDLWGLLALHTYGRYGHRVSFPVRQLCKLLGESISRNIERISYANRLQARNLLNPAASDQNPSGYIVAKAEDLLDLFHADFGALSIGDEAKILGPVSNSQELLAVLEYLRIKRFTSMHYSQDIKEDFPDIDYPHGFELIAGMLTVPLSAEGKDFIVFFRQGVVSEVRWAGNPYANKTSGEQSRLLEPRKSFKLWTEQVMGKSRVWTDEEKETASVLCLVYGKFIAVWREKESALAASQLTNLLLANASHEVRTPLNAIINYLELALDGPIQGEVRDNLVRSHTASKSLIHVINDLLDLTRVEQGNELFLIDPFNISETLHESISVHREEAKRRGLSLDIVENPSGTPPIVLGDRGKIRQIVSNVAANALKHTKEGGILIEWGELVDADIEDALHEKQDSIRIGISVTDTGVGISEQKLENIFRQFEQVSTIGDKKREELAPTAQAVGLGLAVVARIVRNLGGQLQVESKVGEGSKFTFVLPFRLPPLNSPHMNPSNAEAETSSDTASLASRVVSPNAQRTPLVRRPSRRSAGSWDSKGSKASSGRSDIDAIMHAMSSTHLDLAKPRTHQPLTNGKPPSLSSLSSQSAFSNGSFYTAPTGSISGSTGSSAAAPSSLSARSGKAGVSVADNEIPLRTARILSKSSANPVVASPSSSPGPLTASPGPNSLGSSFHPPHGSSPSPLGPGSPTGSKKASLHSPSSPTPPRSLPMPPVPRELACAPSETGTAATTPRPSTTAKPIFSTHVAGIRHISEYKKSPPATVEDRVTKMRVLVVEDELVNRMIIQQRLKKDGHEVVVAEHGGVAVRKFEEDRNFDVILMDLQMPIMNGLEATKNIRRIEKESPLPQASRRPSAVLNTRVPVLAVSASLPERERATIVEAELDGWSLKPISFDRLRELLRGAVDAERRRKDIYQPGHWERGGWLSDAPTAHARHKSPDAQRSRSSPSQSDPTKSP